MGRGRNARPGPPSPPARRPKAYRVRGKDLDALVREMNRPGLTPWSDLWDIAKELIAHAEPIEDQP